MLPFLHLTFVYSCVSNRGPHPFLSSLGFQPSVVLVDFMHRASPRRHSSLPSAVKVCRSRKHFLFAPANVTAYFLEKITQREAHERPIMENQLTAALKVQAMLSTIRMKDDPAEVFFDRLPAPEEMHSVMSLRAHEDMGQRIGIILHALNFFCREVGQDSKDPGFDYIMDFVIKGPLQVPTGFLAPMGNSMAYLALKKSRNGEMSSQGTKKDQHLAYYLWRLHGLKDEASPISAPKTKKSKEASGVSSHDFLPSSRKRRGPCSNCGHAQANNWCSGCCITKSGKAVSATFYCDRGCMKAHWKVHKPACKEVRAMRRAAAVFTELWLGYLQLTDYHDIQSVVEEDGLIEIVSGLLDRRAFLGEGMFRQFPRHLVNSEEQALACMTVKTCEDIAKEGRMLFELVMRRKKGPIV